MARHLEAAGQLTLFDVDDPRSYGEPSRHAMPAPFAGGDLEEPGVMEAALKARAPSKELVFLSVGDTRDHRRMNKDPALRTISMDFLLNLLANLQVSVRVTVRVRVRVRVS